MIEFIGFLCFLGCYCVFPVFEVNFGSNENCDLLELSAYSVVVVAYLPCTWLESLWTPTHSLLQFFAHKTSWMQYPNGVVRNGGGYLHCILCVLLLLMYILHCPDILHLKIQVQDKIIKNFKTALY